MLIGKKCSIFSWESLIWQVLKSSRSLQISHRHKDNSEFNNWQVLTAVFQASDIVFRPWSINQGLTFLSETLNWREYWVIHYLVRAKWGLLYASAPPWQHQLKLFRLFNLQIEPKEPSSIEVRAKACRSRKKDLLLMNKYQFWNGILKNKDNWE